MSGTRVPESRQLIGILGGLGPYAHIDLERKLLAVATEMVGARRDQDFPEWIVSSLPRTPDRTAAIHGDGASPLPELTRSLRRLADADFLLVACNSAHHYLDDLRRQTEQPILDMIDECAASLGRRLSAGSRVGILATTGTLDSGLYHRALAARGLQPCSPLDVDGGAELQRQLVMDAIYGRRIDNRAATVDRAAAVLPEVVGLKADAGSQSAREALLGAARVLVEELGARALIAGCTEIPMALTESEVYGVPLADSVDVIARIAVARAYGLSDHG